MAPLHLEGGTSIGILIYLHVGFRGAWCGKVRMDI